MVYTMFYTIILLLHPIYFTHSGKKHEKMIFPSATQWGSFQGSQIQFADQEQDQDFV